MFSIGANSNKIAYGIKHYILDAEKDFEAMPTDIKVGCTCFVIETSKYYMLNHQSKWVEISPFGESSSSSGGNGSGDDDYIYDGGDVVPSEPEKDDIIYDGGII